MVLIALLLACPEPKEVDSAEASASGPTYYADVRPILDQSCARCHAEGGQALSFDAPETVVAYAGAIAAATEEGRMPPPAPDPACNDYVGSSTLVLDASERATLREWADAGAPLGDPAEAPAPYTPDTIAPFDVTMLGSAPYQPSFGEDGNDYRCFVLEVGNDRRTYATGFEALVDNPSIVHHIVLWELPDNYDAPVAEDGKPGFACDGFGEDGWDFFAGWAPGGQPMRLADGQGMRLERQTRFALQMHYYESHPEADQEFDQSGYGLITAEDVETEIFQMPLGVEDFTIPAGDALYEEEMFLPWNERWGAVAIVATAPHMHLLGSGFDFNVNHADGSETCVVDMDDWDFHNQYTVQLLEPVSVVGGDVVTVTCSWDNSAGNPNQINDPPQDVVFGEQTDQEMCYAFTYGYTIEGM
jgi:hypothetical protein